MRNRTASTLLAACLCLLLAGCKSNNADGRLVGHWVCSSAPALPPGVSLTWDFGADSSFKMTLAGPNVNKVVTGKYHPSWGDTVYMDTLSEPVGGASKLVDDMTISGNQLTARDPDGTTAVFTKQ